MITTRPGAAQDIVAEDASGRYMITEIELITCEIELPWPPSVNTYYRTHRGRMLLSEKGRKYKKHVKSLWALLPKFGDLRLMVEIYAFPPDRRKRDIDNIIKPVLDALEGAGVYDNDSQIDSLSIRRKGVVKGGSLLVTISEHE